MSAESMLNVARSQLGISEDPPYSNRNKYTDWYGMVGAWCDIFISWCADQSGNKDVIGRFAYTPSHEAWFRAQGREVNIREAEPGDILFFNFIGRTSHVGIVEANRGDGLITIEGNTNGSGSRDGGSVIRHFRSWSSGIVSVHRPAYSNEGEFVMDADAAAAFFGTNIRLLQIEQREIARDKRRWRRLFSLLNRSAEQDAEDEARLVEIQSEIEDLQGKIDALPKK